MTLKDELTLQQISNKMDTLIRLTALNLVKNTKTQRDQIALLSEAGFQPKQIAEIVGSNSNVVSVTLNLLKKKKLEQETKHEIKESNSETQERITENVSTNSREVNGNK